MDETLIDEIYEAAFFPEKWEKVLEGLGAIAGCDRSMIFVTNGNEARGAISTRSAAAAVSSFIEDGWMEKNSMGQRALKWGVPAFGTDFDLFTQEEIDTDAFYRDFLRPQGLGWCAGTVLKSPSEDAVIISLHRTFEMGPVEQGLADKLTLLRPHLGRATLTSARLRLEEARNTVTTLGDLGLPAAAMSVNGKLRAANEAFALLMPRVVADFTDRLRFSHRGADVLFVNALGRGNTGTRSGLSFPVPKGESDVPMVVHLVPIRRGAQDIFSNLHWLLIAIPVSHSGTLESRLLEGLFDLTPTEARVARGILFGKSLSEIAREHAVSPETARSQLKAVLAKTGTNRQAELASLLGRLKTPTTFSD